jgi:hypothetical protein
VAPKAGRGAPSTAIMLDFVGLAFLTESIPAAHRVTAVTLPDIPIPCA